MQTLKTKKLRYYECIELFAERTKKGVLLTGQIYGYTPYKKAFYINRAIPMMIKTIPLHFNNVVTSFRKNRLYNAKPPIAVP